jgi:hypothetical protein
VASFLLLLFVSDLGLHVAEALGTSPERSREAGWHVNHEPAAHSDCGIPGHSNTPFHHHHYPAVVSDSSVSLVLTTRGWIHGGTAPEAIHASPLASRSRAPPLA